MKLYVGEYWVPFPSSEYGGLWVVVAENEEQVCEMLLKQHGYYDGEYDDLIAKAVSKARVFYLDHVHNHSAEIVDVFFT
jgi:hypothetical protein